MQVDTRPRLKIFALPLVLLAGAAPALCSSCNYDWGLKPDAPSSTSDSKLTETTKVSDGSKLYPCDKADAACDAHDACALNPICGKDLICYPTSYQNCNDNLSCTEDTCDKGKCNSEISADYCVLLNTTGGSPDASLLETGASGDGVKKEWGLFPDYGPVVTASKCFAKWERHPKDPCLECNPTKSATSWSPATGNTCKDGNSCTKDDVCDSGVCKGTDYSSTCSDGYSCTNDLCDGKGGCLGSKLDSNYCFISNTCYQDGQSDSTGCFVCDVSKSQSTWTTAGSHCVIASKCYTNGAMDSTGCLKCDYATNPNGWTPVSGANKTSYGFESGSTTGWTLTASDTTVKWQVSNKRASGGSYSLYYGNPAVYNYISGSIANSGTATTPSISLTSGKKAVLNFSLWAHVETSANYDKIQVYVVTSTGNTLIWQKNLTSTITMQLWTDLTANLTPYAGSSIQIQFSFSTMDGTSNSTEGVYIDDVTIIENC